MKINFNYKNFISSLLWWKIYIRSMNYDLFLLRTDRQRQNRKGQNFLRCINSSVRSFFHFCLMHYYTYLYLNVYLYTYLSYRQIDIYRFLICKFTKKVIFSTDILRRFCHNFKNNFVASFHICSIVFLFSLLWWLLCVFSSSQVIYDGFVTMLRIALPQNISLWEVPYFEYCFLASFVWFSLMIVLCIWFSVKWLQ